jgi:NAD(P)-dependent dehydrogenase (short-subunit alcohol dehydrogenase family)
VSSPAFRPDGRHLQGRVALVSGVARAHGTGRAAAIRLARAGALVVGADLVADHGTDTATVAPALFAEVMGEVQEVAAAAGGEAIAIEQTEASPASWEGLVATTVERFGRIDICCSLNGVTGASAGDGGLLDITPAAWQRGVDLNLTAAFLLLTAAARVMVAGGRPGALVQLSTSASLTAKPRNGAVGATRSAVNFLVAVLAQELGPHGIRCNAVAPLGIAPTATHPNPGLEKLAQREAGGTLAEWAALVIPLGRMQEADETAAVVEFLCSDAASFVSGHTVPVTGGSNG